LPCQTIETKLIEKTHAISWERKSNKRYSNETTQILYNWLSNNKDSACTPEDKRKLAEQTNLSITQITYWLNHNKKKVLDDNISADRMTTYQKILLKNHFIHFNTYPETNEIKKLAVSSGLLEKKLIHGSPNKDIN
jgi:hypothetical protein